MADLIDRQRLINHLEALDEGGLNWCRIVVLSILRSFPTVDAVEVGSCEGCIYSNRERPQKCSCCRRNRCLKDCYCVIPETIRREENGS